MRRGARFAGLWLVCAAASSAEVPLELKPGSWGEKIISVIVPPDRSYTLETSDLTEGWVVFRHGRGASQRIEHADWLAPVLSKRFYRLRQFGAPANDAFSRAELLPSDGWSLERWNFNAGIQKNEPLHAREVECKNSVWFKWIAPADGELRVDTVGSYFDTVIAVYTGRALPLLEPIELPRSGARAVNLSVTGGEEYHICLGGAGGEEGLLQFHGSFAPEDPLPEIPDSFRVTVTRANQQTQELRIERDRWSLVADNKVIAEGEVRGRAKKKDSWEFELDGESSETWEFVNGGKRHGTLKIHKAGRAEEGLFQHLRTERAERALETLAGVQLVGTRRWTTTGPVGQSHYYTFTPDGRFHDTDNEEQASGHFAYTVSGKGEAELTLFYEGPGDFTGDRHDLHLTFGTSLEGTFESEYHRNDGTEIIVNGDFVVLDEGVQP